MLPVKNHPRRPKVVTTSRSRISSTRNQRPDADPKQLTTKIRFQKSRKFCFCTSTGEVGLDRNSFRRCSRFHLDASEGRSPGRELFTEHVHFTLDGHWLVARTIARKVVEVICHQEWNAKAVPSTEERDERLGLIPLDQLSAAILTSFIVQPGTVKQGRRRESSVEDSEHANSEAGWRDFARKHATVYEAGPPNEGR